MKHRRQYSTKSNTVCSKSRFTEKKSNYALLRTVIRIEICLNVLKHVPVRLQEWRKELEHVPSQCSLTDDFDRRVEFSAWFLIRCEAEPEFLRRILWRNEASFKLNGRINRHNGVYWSDCNPHEIVQVELNVPGLTV
jgi:hypothetical protein